MAAIVKPTLQFLLDWNRAPNLCVSADFLDVLRDFSATTRIGELAQGISYAFWKWERGYSWIADFGPWAAGLNPPYAGSKSPDFIMLNLLTNDIAIMESKGTGSACHKAPMRKALVQCKSALAHIGVSRGFGSVLTLDSKTLTGAGTLHIRDPESSAELTDELKHCVFLRSYASWFDLIGDEDRLTECRQRFSAESGASENSQAANQKDDNSNNTLRDITAAAIGFDPARTSYEIDSEIEVALRDINAFKQINWLQFSERMQMQMQLKSEQKKIWFPDGTAIVERST